MASKSGGARAAWSGKWAFILAAAASAIGLGNLWRFPYLAAKYGGGVFLITYVVLVVSFGFTLMMLEAALGRKTGQSALGAFKSFGKKYAFIGILTSAIPFIIVPYYCIIGGWVLKYAGAYITDGSAALADGGTYFTNFISGGGESFIWAIAFLAIVFAIVALGVKNGIERANRILMPILIVMTVGICIYELTMPGAIDGLAYYLTPDFSKFSVQLVVAALGQMFYSLSLAMGIMITYGSYMQKSDDLEQSVRHIEIFDTGYAFLAGLMIVPAAFVAMGSADAVASKSGPSLMFIILPNVFDQMGGIASIMGFLFFLLVVFAALTSSISLTETCVSIVQDSAHTTRKKGAWHHHGVHLYYGHDREPRLLPAGHDPAAWPGQHHPGLPRLHLELGDDAHRRASGLRVRRLGYQAESHHRRGQGLQPLQGREDVHRHGEVHRAGAAGHHSACLRGSAVRPVQHVARSRDALLALPVGEGVPRFLQG